MGRIAALEYMLFGMRGFLWPRLTASCNKCRSFLRPRHRWSLSVTERPRAGQLDAQAHPEWGGRHNGQTGGEILPVHVYHDEGKRRCGLLPGLVHFRLVAPPPQSRVVGHIQCEVCGFPVICCWRKLIISRIVGCNQRPAVARVLDLDSSAWCQHE
jgi:hypothetical protein